LPACCQVTLPPSLQSRRATGCTDSSFGEGRRFPAPARAEARAYIFIISNLCRQGLQTADGSGIWPRRGIARHRPSAGGGASRRPQAVRSPRGWVGNPIQHPASSIGRMDGWAVSSSPLPLSSPALDR
jgi:hypothetical protein